MFGSFEQIAGAVNIRVIQVLRMLGPEAVIGGHVEDELAARDCPG
jgi:hypothetical protein